MRQIELGTKDAIIIGHTQPLEDCTQKEIQTMRGYAILRYFTPVALMFAWVLYQLVIRKKKWASVKADALTCFVFAAVWILLAYMFIG